MTPRCCRWYTRLRRPVQILVFCALCALPWANAHGWNIVNGNFFALNLAGLPFADPLSAAQPLAAGAMPGPRLWIGAAAALGLALVLGRVFCSWACPYGLLSECARGLSTRLHGIRKQAAVPEQRRPSPFFLRLGIVILGLFGAALLGLPVLNRLSMPGELSLLPLAFFGAPDTPFLPGETIWWMSVIGGLLIIAAVLLTELAVGKRLWCRYICPQSVLLGLAARCLPSGLRVRWTPQACTCRAGQRPCRDACSLELNPRRRDGVSRLECTNCGDCVAACAQHGGALRLTIGRDRS